MTALPPPPRPPAPDRSPPCRCGGERAVELHSSLGTFYACSGCDSALNPYRHERFGADRPG